MDIKLTPQEVHNLKRIRHVVEETGVKEWKMESLHSMDGTRHCFIGHMENQGLTEHWTTIEQKLQDANIMGAWTRQPSVVKVNDDRANCWYPQQTPRGRCIAYLRDVFKFFGLKWR